MSTALRRPPVQRSPADVLIGRVGLSDDRGNLLVPMPAVWHLFHEQWRRALLVLAKHRQDDWHRPWHELPGGVRAVIQANLMQAIPDGLGMPCGSSLCREVSAQMPADKTAHRYPPVKK